MNITQAQRPSMLMENIPSAEAAGEYFAEALIAFSNKYSPQSTIFWGDFFQSLRGVVRHIVTQPARTYFTVLGGTSIGLATLWAAPLIVKYIHHKFDHSIGSPKVAIHVTKRTLFSKTKVDEQKAIFSPDIKRKIDEIVLANKYCAEKGGKFQNLLLYGPPGTGKTLIAREIAERCNMGLYEISGGMLAQYISRGEHVTKVNELFDNLKSGWRPWDTKPKILFIDEAETLCSRRELLDMPLREVQNAVLNHTGDQSSSFMIIFVTNRRDDFDEAIESRIDQKILIGPPGQEERKSILKLYTTELFSAKEVEEFFQEEKLEALTDKTSNLTGRDIYKLLNAILYKKISTKEAQLTQNIIDEKVQDFMLQTKPATPFIR